MAVVATAERGLIVYQLENQPSEFRRIESPLKHQVICLFQICVYLMPLTFVILYTAKIHF